MPTAKATLDGTTLASTSDYHTVEGNIYFPASSLIDKESHFKPSETHTTCYWKGEASYYTLDVNGKQISDAAWFYPHPYEKAQHIKDYVAFYKTKVKVTVE